MPIKTNYRDSKWFVKNLKNMTAIANEPPRADFYSELRNDLFVECALPLKKGKLQSVYGLINSSLAMLSWECMTKGAIAVLNNDMQGWKELRRGFLYDAWAARYRHAFIVHDNCYDEPHNPASAAIFEGKEALTLSHAIATGDDKFARGFGKHLLANFEKTGGGDKVYFYTMPFFPFVLKLFSIWVGKEIAFCADVAQPLGRYQQIFDSWADASSLTAALLDLCDLHCEEAVDKGGYPAFAYHPYNLFPVEIMSIYRIRQSLSLETPQVAHPLLQSKLFYPPIPSPHVEDPVLDRVIGRFRSDNNEGMVSW